jgi:uncharacterized protein YdhG (YjbR/CyaY superfamily)
MKRMKVFASFDEYLEAQSPKNQAIIRALRKFVKRIEPKLSEAVKWGNGCWIGSNRTCSIRVLRYGVCAIRLL